MTFLDDLDEQKSDHFEEGLAAGKILSNQKSQTSKSSDDSTTDEELDTDQSLAENET